MAVPRVLLVTSWASPTAGTPLDAELQGLLHLLQEEQGLHHLDVDGDSTGVQQSRAWR